MTLGEAIEQNKGEMLYIGSGYGFLAITREPTDELLNEITEEQQKSFVMKLKKYTLNLYHLPKRIEYFKRNIEQRQKDIAELKETMANYEKAMSCLPETCAAYKSMNTEYTKMTKTLKTLENGLYGLNKSIKDSEERIKWNVNRKARIEEILTTWKPLKDRNVIEISNHCSEPKGKIIIFEGSECGAYWFYEEYVNKNIPRRGKGVEK